MKTIKKSQLNKYTAETNARALASQNKTTYYILYNHLTQFYCIRKSSKELNINEELSQIIQP